MTSLTSPDESLGTLTGSFSLSLDTSLGTTPPRGYPLELLDVNDKKFQCGLCHLILRQPVQSYCGHRFCKACLIYFLRTNLAPVICQMCVEEKSEEVGTLNVAQMYPDNALKREFSRMKVRCPFMGCSWASAFKEFEVHYEQCEFFLQACNLCNVQVLRTDMISHQFNVHNIGTDCPFGCEQKIDVSRSVAHMEQYCLQHLDVIHRRIQNLEQSFEDPRQILSSENLPSQSVADQKVAQLELAIKYLDDELRNFRVSARCLQDVANVSAEPPPIAKLFTIKEQLTIHEAIITVLSREIERLSVQLEIQESKRRQNREKIEAVERKTKSLEQGLQSTDSVVADIDQRLTSMELTSYNGVLLWKVSDFQRRRQESVSQRTPSINSPVFYSSHTGYKMCARLYLNGDGNGRNTHVSLYFVVMRGQFDALLTWPFSHKVTLTIFDQGESGRESVSDSFRPDPTSSSFKRPTTDVNVASGCPQFIRITQLENKTCNFVKDNAIFIKIVVDTNDGRNEYS